MTAPAEDQILHAGLIAVYESGRWRGVLIEGDAGSGKSDLALRALRDGFRLVADDRVLIWASGGSLWGGAPRSIAGMMEVRGLGVLPESALSHCRIVLCVRAGTPERLPDPTSVSYLGLHLPLVLLPLLEASAPAKLRHALRRLGGGAEGAYHTASRPE